ncbi:MAG: alpha,alpha-trehalose-phosphate synthase (UDP-forming) [Parvibaculum sp.]|uniref:alpha,alpha-trehalose-phosphate synthase (UDP-forming) n=1 Tax=Parvibaculum sp. TaxID=2024848 RepID=UPI0032EFA4A9
MSRLVVVSNRVGPVKDAARAGGLAVALVDALRAQGGLWYGWSGKTNRRAADSASIESAENLDLATVDLTPDEHTDYYNGFANRCLWPLFHYRIDLTAFDRRYYEGYRRVNAKFARVLFPLLRADDTIWVHDYHFLAFGNELRHMGAEQPIGFFLHIPFPAREVLATLPHHDAMVRGLFAYDVLGFQTERDCERFRDYAVREAGGVVNGDHVHCFGRTVAVHAFPIGIDTEGFAQIAAEDKEARRQYEKVTKGLAGRCQIVGVDRLDYTKGIAERFQAYERLLKEYPETHRQVSYLQIAATSRGEVAEYRQMREELDGLSGHINGTYGDFDWTPLRYLNKPMPRRALAGLYRASKIGLVTPLRDGMNLVAKEYVAAQDPEDPGVLILSRFAGASYQMPEAIIVNPYDTKEVADALQIARYMSLQERRERFEALMVRLKTEDVARWRDDFLSTLAAVRRRVPAAS